MEKYNLCGISAHIRPEAVEESLPYIDALGIRYVFIPHVATEEFETPESTPPCSKTRRKQRRFCDARGVVFGYHNHAHEYAGGNDYLGKYTADAGLKAELDVFWAYVAGKDAVSR